MLANPRTRNRTRTIAFLTAALVGGAIWLVTPDQRVSGTVLLSPGEAATLLGGQAGCPPNTAYCKCDDLTCEPTGCPNTSVTASCTSDGAGGCHKFKESPGHTQCGIQSGAHFLGCNHLTAPDSKCGTYYRATPPGSCAVMDPCEWHTSSVISYCGDPLTVCTQY